MYEHGGFEKLYKCIGGHTRYVRYMRLDAYEAGLTVTCFECPESMGEVTGPLKECYEASLILQDKHS